MTLETRRQRQGQTASGVSNSAHKTESRIGQWLRPADLQAVYLPVTLAGRCHGLPPDSAAFTCSTRVHSAVALSLRIWARGGGHFFQFSRNHELAGQDARDATDALPSIDLLHAQHVGGSHGREVVKVSQGVGNVCRAFG